MSKYLVECEKHIKCIFVVDAEDDYKCDKKLEAGQFEKKFEVVTSTDSYLGYEYKNYEKYSGVGDEAVISSIEDLCRELGTEPAHLERYMFKYTDNGIPIEWNKDGVTLCAYAEGADDCGYGHTLLFPFTMKDFNSTLEYVEQESDELWHMWNDEEEEEE